MQNAIQIHHRSDVDPEDVDLTYLINLVESWGLVSRNIKPDRQTIFRGDRIDLKLRIKKEVKRLFEEEGLYVDALEFQLVETSDRVQEIVESELLPTYELLDEAPRNITSTIVSL